MRYIALFLFGIAIAQSQPPSPAPSKVGHGKQEDRTANHERIKPQNGQPPDSTVVVNEYYSQPNDEGKRQRDAKQDEAAPKGWVDWLLAVSTLLLFFATVALCIIAGLQWGTMKAHKKSLEGMADHMEKGLAETKTAACAAKNSSDIAHATFVNAHRPLLVIRNVSADGIENISSISGRFLVFNTGNTKAILVSGFSEIVAYPEGVMLPANPPYEGKIGNPFVDIVLLPGQHAPVFFPTTGPTTEPTEYRDFDLQRRGNIFLIGWIEYLDEAQRTRRMGFARRYNRHIQRFQIEISEDYHYND